MKHWMILAALAAASTPAAPAAPDELVPGAIYAQTVRSGTTLTAPGKPAVALGRGENFAASGQALIVPGDLAAALILSNGDSLFLPAGGKLTFEEFLQEPVFDTGRDRDYEPSRSSLRLNLAQGTLVIAGRKPVPTSALTVTTSLAQINCRSQAIVVQAAGENVTVTVLDGTAEVSIPGTNFHDTVQSGQTATLTKVGLRDAYPLKLATTQSQLADQTSDWVATVRQMEARVVFTGPKAHLKPALSVPQEYTQQMSADDPRFR